MDARRLRNAIDAEDVRPAWIQRNRDELSELLDSHVPRASVADLDEWWSRNKSVVGREVNAMLEETEVTGDDDESDEDSSESETSEEDN